MSTNYYLRTKNIFSVKKYFDHYEKEKDGYEIHIGKRSGGWEPIFQRHDRAWKSVEEMLQFIKTHKEFKIYDEYNQKLSIDELKENLVMWGENQKKRMINDPVVGEIMSPINHLEYIKRANDPYDRKELYSKDKNGYTFLNTDFC